MALLLTFLCDRQRIPAGSDILLDMDSVLCDPEVFDEPYKFKPERFLTGDVEMQKQHALYFGIGERYDTNNLMGIPSHHTLRPQPRIQNQI